MKPDKKKESITEEYQRPPLLEEIKKFKEELKLVSSFILFSAGVVAIIAFWNKVALKKEGWAEKIESYISVILEALEE